MEKIKKIRLGYEVGSGKEINISPSHLIVTGLSQLSGKTTTLESLIKRSNRKAIVFRTKVGEKGFLSGTIIPPYFKDRSDWQYIESLVEATMKEKLHRDERANIIKLSKQTSGKSLLEFKKKVDQRLQEKKIGKWEENVLTNLQAYLDIVVPKLQSITFSNELELIEGLNIIDLERFSRDSEVQSLIIRSVLEEVLYNRKNVIIVIPEAWKFIPQNRGNPCKIMVEEFIRQGATNGNYIWIDSQDMAGVDKTPLKQISEWILGYQSEINEVKHTLQQIPLPKAQKPKSEDIMSLGKGIFYYTSRDLTTKIYVQPFWLDDNRAIKIAKGKLDLDKIDMPETLTPFKIAVKKESNTEQEKIDFQETSKRFNKELTEMRTDFFNKIEDIQQQMNKLNAEIFTIRDTSQNQNEDELIAKVLQKLPQNPTDSTVDINSIITQVLQRIPKSTGNVVYEVAPLEKLQKDFLEETKQKILAEVEKLSESAKRMLKYLEARSQGVKTSELVEKCFFMKVGGGASNKVSEASLELRNYDLIKKDSAGWHRANLKERIKEMIETHNASEQEVENLYQHILMEMLPKNDNK